MGGGLTLTGQEMSRSAWQVVRGPVVALVRRPTQSCAPSSTLRRKGSRSLERSQEAGETAATAAETPAWAATAAELPLLKHAVTVTDEDWHSTAAELCAAAWAAHDVVQRVEDDGQWWLLDLQLDSQAAEALVAKGYSNSSLRAQPNRLLFAIKKASEGLVWLLADSHRPAWRRLWSLATDAVLTLAMHRVKAHVLLGALDGLMVRLWGLGTQAPSVRKSSVKQAVAGDVGVAEMRHDAAAAIFRILRAAGRPAATEGDAASSDTTSPWYLAVRHGLLWQQLELGIAQAAAVPGAATAAATPIFPAQLARALTAGSHQARVISSLVRAPPTAAGADPSADRPGRSLPHRAGTVAGVSRRPTQRGDSKPARQEAYGLRLQIRQQPDRRHPHPVPHRRAIRRRPRARRLARGAGRR